MMFACLFLGQSKPQPAWATDKIRGVATREIIALPDRPKLTQTMEGYYAMKSHVLAAASSFTTGIIDEPIADDPRTLMFSLHLMPFHYAKGVAHATMRGFAVADRERELFYMHLDRIPPERRFLSNPARASLARGGSPT